jgi:hypothetical protein
MNYDFDDYDFGDFGYDNHMVHSKPKPNFEESEESEELSEKLKKLKILDINENNTAYPKLKISLLGHTYEVKVDKVFVVNSSFIFGPLAKKQKINKLPFFVCNMLLKVDLFQKALLHVSDDILLESIVIINSMYNKKDITKLSDIKAFKKYLSYHFLKNISFDFYVDNLQKLMFFFEKLFTEFLKELLKTNSLIETDDLNEIDDIVRKNIKTIIEILTKTSFEYEIKNVQALPDNIYQDNFGIIDISGKARLNQDTNRVYKKYVVDFNNNLKKVVPFFKKKFNHGNFYIVVKNNSLCGSFHSFIFCDLREKKNLPQLVFIKKT